MLVKFVITDCLLAVFNHKRGKTYSRERGGGCIKIITLNKKYFLISLVLNFFKNHKKNQDVW